ncbi:hypothetical protein BDV25DRAFT_141335 [Aspergillus avenaceus]|uniref:PHD-type domain-containing protein n=1 Tax=Aspergillus avenaceus TaxID=36643 RepID=A0A5N6TRC2_ASPAV|nr:hypothetical protein BDV25DRAFT_141335 [Aspergillus avenaceus]
MLRTNPEQIDISDSFRKLTPRTLQHGAISQSRPPMTSVSEQYGNIYNMSAIEKSVIYEEWIRTGKPHNLVCSVCRNPDNLMPCETCCRSYHRACLPQGVIPPLAAQFYCSECKNKRWDQSPPQFDKPPSSTVSRSSTPGANGSSGVSSPSEHGSHAVRQPHPLIGAATSATAASSSHSSPEIDRQRPFTSRQCTINSDVDIFTQAKQLLMEYGRFPADQEFRPELLLKLGSMMMDLHSLQSLHQELQGLRAENTALRNENSNVRSYFTSNLPSNEPLITSSVSRMPPILPGSSADTSEKTWDRIVMDLI